MSFSISSNSSPQNSEQIVYSLNERESEVETAEEARAKAIIMYERYKQKKLEARERYDRMTPSEQREDDIRRTISIKRMSDMELTPEEIQWMISKRKKPI